MKVLNPNSHAPLQKVMKSNLRMSESYLVLLINKYFIVHDHLELKAMHHLHRHAEPLVP